MAAQAGEELGGGQPGQGIAHAGEVLAPFALRVPEIRDRILPSEETVGTAKEFLKGGKLGKRWADAKTRYQAKQAPSSSSGIPAPAAAPARDPAVMKGLADQYKGSSQADLEALYDRITGKTSGPIGPKSRYTPPPAQAPSNLPAPKPLHQEAHSINEESTPRKVQNLMRHFQDQGLTYDQLKAMHDQALATKDWSAIQSAEREAWNTGKALEDQGVAAGTHVPGDIVPANPYKPPSASKSTAGTKWQKQATTDSTWERLLQSYPRSLPAPNPPPMSQP